jgi:hypothetical protein
VVKVCSFCGEKRTINEFSRQCEDCWTDLLTTRGAKGLRAAGVLWPQTLTDGELRAELDAVDGEISPIAARMLREEAQVRAATVERLQGRG